MSEKYFLGAMTQNGFSTEFGKIMADKEYFTFTQRGCRHGKIFTYEKDSR